MLEINIDERELFNDATSEFYTIPKTTIKLEHSLYAIAKWECKYEKSFFSKVARTEEELLDYVKFMTINEVEDEFVYYCMTRKDFETIKEYLGKPMTARKPGMKQNKGYRFLTAEDFYYSMFEYGIPLECEKWNFNRLVALLNYCSVHNSDGRKMNKKEQSKMYSELNAARRKALGSKG